MSFTSDGLVLQCPSVEMQNCTDCSCPQRPSHTCPTIKVGQRRLHVEKKTYCFTSSFTTQNKIKNLPCVSSTTLIWTHKQVTGLDRPYTTKVAAAKILGLIYQVTSEGFGKSPSEYDDSPVGFSMPHFGQACVH